MTTTPRREVATLRAERDDALAKLKDRDDNDAWWREQRDMWGEQLKDSDEQITTLRALVQQLEQALRDVEKHHAILNGQVGRGEERSTTLAIVRAALGTTPQETP